LRLRRPQARLDRRGSVQRAVPCRRQAVQGRRWSHRPLRRARYPSEPLLCRCLHHHKRCFPVLRCRTRPLWPPLLLEHWRCLLRHGLRAHGVLVLHPRV
ncbi:hypothetical protein BN1723_019602, partial [Verticillium longisporum]